jgi:hypothetical protein
MPALFPRHRRESTPHADTEATAHGAALESPRPMHAPRVTPSVGDATSGTVCPAHDAFRDFLERIIEGTRSAANIERGVTLLGARMTMKLFSRSVALG